jgi:hypothetical protein
MYGIVRDGHQAALSGVYHDSFALRCRVNASDAIGRLRGIPCLPGTVREIAVRPAARLLGAGDLEVRVDEDVMPGVRRLYMVDDPWGNRVELLA